MSKQKSILKKPKVDPESQQLLLPNHESGGTTTQGNRTIDVTDTSGQNCAVSFRQDEKSINSEGSDDEQDQTVSQAQHQFLKDMGAATTDGGTSFQVTQWKPRSETSYETLALAKTQFNCKIRGAGFRKNGKMRHIKKTCLLAKIKTRCRIRQRNPALAICITMYNENATELKNTLRGLIHNYNCFRADPNFSLTKDDFVINVICDGYERIPEDFKELAREKGWLNEQTLIDKGFMEKDPRDGKLKMRPIEDIMDKKVKQEDIPQNLLHLFQVTTWDVGLDDDILKGRRVHICFGIKHRNDGKINSHKWFFQGICKYLKPELCLMLDIGTQADEYAIMKLYAHMQADIDCGGCCGEIEVDLSNNAGDGGIGSYMVQASQFFEYKLGHTPDKACESFFGFTQVLPGAYCMFRWNAIKGGPLDAFFKNVTRTETPTCSEANEYLAEDRIMCLEIYIKIQEKYKLAYIPDAKAFTDAPPSMMILMKQRRRWQNGALFGTAKVISNFVNMVSCRRTKHNCCRQIMMTVFMTYTTTLYAFQFFIVGAMFAAIYVFFDQVFASVFEGNWQFSQAYNDGIFSEIFVYIYVLLLVMCLVIALALPLDRASVCFMFVTIMFGLLTIACIFGMAYYLSVSGFEPEEMVYDKDTAQWHGNGQHHFSWLVLAGVTMLSVYIVPFVMRPLDFLENFRGYIIGLVSYLLLIPMYTNVFQIYGMSNLHDISWGNRPSVSGGTEAFSATAAKQQSTATDYMAFRANFLFFWLCCNGAYFFVVLNLGKSGSLTLRNSGAFGVLEGFSMYLAGIVLFRVFFAILHTIKWKFRFCCNKKYKIEEYNLEKTFKKIKKDPKTESTDDEQMDQEAERIFAKHEQAITATTNANGFHDTKTKAGRITAALEYHHDIAKNSNKSDSDEDQLQFQKADAEEVEDNLVRRYTAQKRPLNRDAITRISGTVSLAELNSGVLRKVTGMKMKEVRRMSNKFSDSEEDEDSFTTIQPVLKATAVFRQPESEVNLETLNDSNVDEIEYDNN